MLKKRLFFLIEGLPLRFFKETLKQTLTILLLAFKTNRILLLSAEVLPFLFKGCTDWRRVECLLTRVYKNYITLTVFLLPYITNPNWLISVKVLLFFWQGLCLVNTLKFID